ncbi:MAG TPA: HVO_0476 family zinc finger protein [Methanocorpusculum sp.]|nr:HVO_0476 family zinc finger protein [Methanocorpusculum sp.]
MSTENSEQETDYIVLDCPVCGCETDFEILKEPPQAVVRCAECGHIMHIVLKEPKIFNVKTIISFGTDSITASVELMEGEKISVGDFLVAEAGEESYNVEVTSLEEKNARRMSLPVEKIDTIWTRLSDTVIIRASLNKGAVTVPLYEQVDGETEYTVDHLTTIGGKMFRVTRIKLRKGNVITRKDKSAKAYEIKRIYGERSVK